MKKTVLKSSLCASLAALAMLFPGSKNSELTDITKPYLGFYECEYARVSGEDISEEFSYIRLELKADDTFVIYYSKKEGKEQRETGKYHYDKEKETICFSTADNAFKRSFSLKEGEIDIALRLGSKTLVAKFKQK
ncbi:MAG: hypothetical protein IJ514_04530 [Clostridia bacterium]|nr:hypothetical protein [Clostridia bacterium]